MATLQDIWLKKTQRETKLRNSLTIIRNQIKEMGALKIILLGSLMTGEIDVNSDLDLLVIMPDAKSTKEWTKLIYEKVERKVASDIIVYNHQEFEDNLPISRFLIDALKRGKVVYEKTS